MKALRGIRRRALAVAMTFLAKQPHLTADQQPVVDRPMRNVTSQTSVGSQRDVLEHERPLFIRMTPHADSAQTPDRLHCLGDIERSMLLMAITTGHPPFRYLVVKRSGKLGANFPMAVIAESGRLVAEDVIVGHFLVRIMAIITGDHIHIVLILVKPTFADALFLVALSAHGDNFPRSGFARIEDVALTPGLHVLTARAVTHLASLIRRNVLGTLDGGEVSGPGIPGELIGMAGSTGVRTNKILRPR